MGIDLFKEWEGLVIPEIPTEAQELLKKMLRENPEKRFPRASNAMASTWFNTVRTAPYKPTHGIDTILKTEHQMRERLDTFMLSDEVNEGFRTKAYRQYDPKFMTFLRKQVAAEIEQIRDACPSADDFRSGRQPRVYTVGCLGGRRLSSLERLIKETNRAYNWTPSDGDTKPVPRSRAEAAVARRLASLRFLDRTYKKRTTENEN